MIGWFLRAVSHLPRPLLAVLAGVLGDTWYYLVRIRRHVALANLSHSTLDPGADARGPLVRRSCRHLVLNVLELPRWVDADASSLFQSVRVEGEQHLQTAFDEGRGVLVVTGHLGNWEILGTVAARLGYPTSLVARRLAGATSQRWIADLRRRGGVGILEDGAVSDICRSLHQGRIVGFTIDQRPRGGAIPALFLGQPARVSRAVATMALRTRAPIVVAVTHRDPDGRHRVHIDPPIFPVRDGRPIREQVSELTRACSGRIERAIAAHPDQWLWHHRRWAMPPSRPDEAA